MAPSRQSGKCHHAQVAELSSLLVFLLKEYQAKEATCRYPPPGGFSVLYNLCTNSSTYALDHIVNAHNKPIGIFFHEDSIHMTAAFHICYLRDPLFHFHHHLCKCLQLCASVSNAICALLYPHAPHRLNCISL